MAAIEKRESKKDGKVTWRCKIRRLGWPTLSRTFDRKQDAEAWAADLERDLRRGKCVDLRAASGVTISAALDRYEEAVSARKKSYKNERKTIRLFKSSTIAMRTLTNVTAADVVVWRDGRLSAGISPYTVRNELALLSHLFSTAAREWGYEGLTNPVSSIKKPKPPAGRDRRLKSGTRRLKSEQDMLLESAPLIHPQLKNVILFAIETAMRVGELASLRPVDIDFNCRVAHLRDTKSGDPRDVPLSKTALLALKEAMKAGKGRDDDPVFGLSKMRISHYFAQLVVKIGLKDLRFHDLRHEATSRLFEKGLNPMQVAAITGHKTLIMLKRYTHLRARDLVKLLD